jgi:hypothetical protein
MVASMMKEDVDLKAVIPVTAGAAQGDAQSRWSNSAASDPAHPSKAAGPSSTTEEPTAGSVTCRTTSSSTRGCLDEGEAVRSFVWSLFENLMGPLLQWAQEHGTPLLPTSSTCLVQGVMAVFESQAVALR